MEPILKVSGLSKTFSRQGQADFTGREKYRFDLVPRRVSRHHRGKRQRQNHRRQHDRPSGGRDLRLRFSGRRGHHPPERQAAREVYRTMQMVFQTPADSFDPRRTLGDGIGESLRNAGLSRKETEKKWKPF